MTTPPNILLFLTDDHAAWALGQRSIPGLATPNLDRLATRGVNFQNAFTPSPVCSPARACVMTGRPPSAVGIHDWLEEKRPEVAAHEWMQDQVTLPELFQHAGYETALVGKWHLGSAGKVPQGFSTCYGLPACQGLHNGQHEFSEEGNLIEIEGNKSTILTDYALRFLRERDTARPFFLNVGYIATHSPYHTECHAAEPLAQAAKADFSAFPEAEPHPWHRNEGFYGEANVKAHIQSCRQGYLAAVIEIDREVGRVLDQLESTGELDNTIVLYTSDHGCCLGHHGVWGKGNGTRPLNFYETSLRVPLLLAGPSIPEGQTVDAYVDHYNTFAFLAELATGKKPDATKYPGRSYAELWEAGSAPWRDQCFAEYGDARMARTRSTKVVLRYGNGPDEQFDLAQDPEEKMSGPVIDTTLVAELEAFYEKYESPALSGLKVKEQPEHNSYEAWRDGVREQAFAGAKS